jgi:hypothetical protein
MSWFVGGAAVLNGVARKELGIDFLRQALKGNEAAKVAKLLYLFSYPMMFRWFRYGSKESQESPRQIDETLKEWVWYLANLFDPKTPADAEGAFISWMWFAHQCESDCRLNRDIRADVENIEDLLMDALIDDYCVAEPFMLGMRALGHCGREVEFVWPEIRTPHRSFLSNMNLVASMRKGGVSISDALRLAALIDRSIENMTRYALRRTVGSRDYL